MLTPPKNLDYNPDDETNYIKNRLDEDCLGYKHQRNFCTNLLRYNKTFSDYVKVNEIQFQFI